ncbi:metallophosphoesterase family protein [Oleisolibacter albus]|uniref:metallophosphoesterase family protein n=1 Tax=Oleisolibacter albus TaxID=2171757 RepID=UPI0030842C4B
MIRLRTKPLPPPVDWPSINGRPARIPAGQRLYVIGDIHGRLDLLQCLLDRIQADMAASGADLHHTLIFLGDYVDRGPDSSGVLSLLSGAPPPGFGAVHLKGNHEEAMLAFLDDPQQGEDWVRFGGQTTLASYGIVRPPAMTVSSFLAKARPHLVRTIPGRHLAFLRGLRTSLRFGDYLFVHAGIRPGLPLAQQDSNDLLWIREPFLKSGTDHGVVVVHGHTIVDKPDIRTNRIGIDTGAYATGCLTCLVLEGASHRFLNSG